MRPEDRRYASLRRAVGQRHGPTAQRLLDDAYDISVDAHAGQYRDSGDPYILHPLEVAWLVTNWGQPPISICAALLHDMSDGLDDLQPVRDLVGNEVVDLVLEVCSFDQDDAPHAFHHTHPIGSSAHAATVIKLADRLHNARTWRFIPAPRAERKARQTLAIYAPVATVVGLPQVGEELESLCTAALNGSNNRSRKADDLAVGLPATDEAFVSGLSGSLLQRAVLLLPAAKRHRYFEEWTAELLAAPTISLRMATALGFNYSAIRMRGRH